MRRELVIIAGVLVPFFVLVALTLLADRPTPPHPAPIDAGPAPARAPIATPVVMAPPSPAPGDAGANAGADAGERVDVPPELAGPLSAVTPEVLRCFDDQRAHLREPQRLEVRFTPLPDGGFAGVRVGTHANPWVTACIEDVFAEVGFAPSGAETFAPARHTFVFDPGAR
jgi:hypothetical protein